MLAAVEQADEAAIKSLFETHIFHGFEALVAHIGVTLLADPFEDLQSSDYDTREDGWWRT